jgi:hypothetical protein
MAHQTMSTPRQRKKALTCDDCFFRCRGLCALDLVEPCSTFRLERPEGLVPPRQPSLLLRGAGDDAGSGLPAGGGMAQPV